MVDKNLDYIPKIFVFTLGSKFASSSFQNLVLFSLMSGSPFEGTEGNLLRLFGENHKTLQQQQQALVAEMAESKVR